MELKTISLVYFIILLMIIFKFLPIYGNRIDYFEADESPPHDHFNEFENLNKLLDELRMKSHSSFNDDILKVQGYLHNFTELKQLEEIQEKSATGGLNRQRRSMEEFYMITVPELVASRGYRCEVHSVTTLDGYLLEIHRIARHNEHLDNDVPRSSINRPAVLIHHGLFSSSATFVLGEAHQTIAYLLVDLGYDVWLGNWRGTTYSKKHLSLNCNQEKFWDFSLDEVMRYDVPAVIDYILWQTGHQKIFYLGHSLGCSVLFGALNHWPQIKDKIKMMVSLAPAAYLGHHRSEALYHAATVHSLYYMFLDEGFLPSINFGLDIKKSLASFLCGKKALMKRHLCYNLLVSLMGRISRPSTDLFTNVLMSHGADTIPASRLIAHFGQLLNVGQGMYAFDYGVEKNLQKYRRVHPPLYNMSAVEFPVAVFYGKGDSVTVDVDVQSLARSLPQVVHLQEMVDPLFSHLDFMFPEKSYPVYVSIAKLFNKWR